MLTNLLGRLAMFNDCGDRGEIVLVHQDREQLYVTLMDNKGVLHTKMPTQIQIVEHFDHAVVVHWSPEQKIRVIKLTREVLNLGLREAKDFVEEQGSPVTLKERISYPEALNILELIKNAKLEGDIRGRLCSQ